MLQILGSATRTCDGLSRRQCLKIGGAGLLGLSVPRLLAAEEALREADDSTSSISHRPRARSVIFLFIVWRAEPA